MSMDRADRNEDARAGATSLLARAQTATTRARLRLHAAIDDFFLSDDGRLDERSRVGLAQLVSAIVGRIEGEVRAAAAQALTSRPDLADTMRNDRSALDRLIEQGLMRDDVLMAELIGRIRLDQLTEALPMLAPERPDQPSLLVQMSMDANPAVARPALALMSAESRRRAFVDSGRLTRSELPAELHHQLSWLVCAAIRGSFPEGSTEVDVAIVEAAERLLAAYDESDGVDGAAMQLAIGIDAGADELGELLLAALQDRRPALMVAVLARALRLDPAVVRDMVTDLEISILLLALRAVDLDRTWLARIGLTLADADPRHDADRLSDDVEAAMAVSVAAAQAALAPLRFPAAYRHALAVVNGSGRP